LVEQVTHFAHDEQAARAVEAEIEAVLILRLASVIAGKNGRLKVKVIGGLEIERSPGAARG